MKNRIILLLPAVFGLLITGCGGKSETPSGSKPSEEQSGDQSGGEVTPSVPQYTITFKDENGGVLESKKWNEGTTPSYNYEIQDTAEWDYTFEGWSLSQGGEIVAVSTATADATYFAIVSKTKRSYTVSFYDENKTLLKSEVLEYGAQPACDYTGPSDTAEWDYTFNGWCSSKTQTIDFSIPTVTEEVNYYAEVSATKQCYSIEFRENDEYVLLATSLPYGDIPEYNYEFSSSMEWSYTFLGWATTPYGEPLTSLPPVTEDAIYYAQIQKTKKQYTITFDSNDGSSVASITADYGTDVAKPTDPKKDGFSFVAWTTDEAGENVVSWPYKLVNNITFYAQWNETVDIKSYLQTLIAAVGHDPYSYIPETMQPENSTNHVTAGSLNYDFNNFTSVSSIKYGGFGEQWHMVIENIKESERFYSILSLGEAAINGSVALFNDYLDNNPGTTASHPLDETEYAAMIDFHEGVLSYSIRYKTNFNIPLFGEVTPQIDMVYDITSLEKVVRIQLSENNAMRYVVTDNSYSFGLEYGITTVSRKAFFQLNRSEDDSVEGHIYEFVQFKDKDMVPSCADFYIDEEYTSVVGNKASGMPGFTGYINELYKTEEGKLLGYEVRETFTKWGFEATYHTLWFNLNNISGIYNVKAIKNENSTYGLGANNNHDIYLNNSATIFEPTYNKKLFVQTSRKYDVEMRKQFFYGYIEGVFTEYEVELPMMFIQADHDEYKNFSEFHDDIGSKSGIDASVNLSSTYLEKIQSDYATLIDIFIEHKGDVTSASIVNYIGNPEDF